MQKKPKMQWRYSGVLVPASTDFEAVMDTIADWLNDSASEYHDGSARTPDQGSAWTAVKEVDGATTVALRLQPPTTSIRKHQRVLIYGRADMSLNDPTHAGGDVKNDDRPFAAHVRGVPHGDETDYQGFDHASPYNGYTWSSFCGIAWQTAEFNGVVILEGIEAISIWFIQTNNLVSAFIAGDILDDYGLIASESDGGIYGITTCGYSSTVSSSMNSSNTFPCTNNTNAGGVKLILYSYGGAATIAPTVNYGAAAGGVNVTSYAGMGLHFRRPLLVCNLDLHAVGAFREVYMVSDVLAPLVVQPAGTPVAYFLSGSVTTIQDALGFEH